MGRIESPRTIFFLVLSALAAAALFYSLVPLTADVSYFVLSAERLLAGDKPYVDILETNPPLAFWTTLPSAAVAEVLGLSPHVAYVLSVCALIAAVLATVWRLGQGQPDRGRMVVALAAGLVLAPNEGFGQREHLATILLMPYLVSLAWKLPLARGWSLATGLMAALGLCFKPLFLLIPAAAEAWRLWQTRRWREIVRLQTIAMALPVLAFPALVWWATPDYYSTVVPLALKTYGAYQRSLLDILVNPAVLSFVILAGVAVPLQRGAKQNESLWLLLAAAGLAIYLAQGKGFSYHLLPGTSFAAIAVLRLALQAEPALWQRVALAASSVLFAANAMAFVNLQRGILATCDSLFAGGEKPRVLLALTYDNGLMFPFVQERGITWGSSYPALWMMPAVAKGQVTGDDAKQAVGFAARRVAGDLTRFQPDQVVVDSRSESLTLAGHRIEYLSLFAAVPEFQQAWQAYELVRDGGTFQIWRRKTG